MRYPVVVAEYLKQYTTALKNQPFELLYIDAFAGAGRAMVEEQKEDSLYDRTDLENDARYRHSSSLQAIQNDPPFQWFIFIDRNEESMAALAIPYGWKKPEMVFVNSMSDLFHKEVPLEFIQNDFPGHERLPSCTESA